MEQRNSRERGLGRGLDALFGDEESSSVTKDPQTKERNTKGYKLIGIEQIYPSPSQPRRYFDEEALSELADSIKEYGILQPIMVRPSKELGDFFEIVAGERRWRAAQLAKLHDIPVIVRDLNDEQTYQIALIENLQRRDLNPLEEARGYQKLIDDYDETPESIGKVVGKSRSHVTNMIRLLSLPEPVLVMIDVEDITAGHARALLGAEKPFELALQVIKGGLSVRGTEKLVAEESGRDIQKRDSGHNKKQKGFAQKDADLLALEKQLSDGLGLNVAVDMKNDSAGAIKIEFKNLDQLDDVLKRLTT